MPSKGKDKQPYRHTPRCREKSSERLTVVERHKWHHNTDTKGSTHSHVYTHTHTHTHARTHKVPRHTTVTQADIQMYTVSHQHTYTFTLTYANTPHTNTHGHTDTHSLKHMHKEPPDSGSGLPWWLETRPPAPGSQPPPHPLEGRFDCGPIPSRLRDLESPFCLGSSPNRNIS